MGLPTNTSHHCEVFVYISLLANQKARLSGGLLYREGQKPTLLSA
jgi:hypothetical protein